jgi:CheY-like chemotaxis protein
MIDELRARFQGRFVEKAKARAKRALEVVGAADRAHAAAVAGELHALAGESSFLAFEEIVAQATQGEQAARRWGDSGDGAALVQTARALRTIARLIDALPPPPAPIRAPAVTGGPAPRVLVVDDSPLNASVMREALAEAGFDARTAVELDLVALRALCGAFRPQVVLADLQMEPVDGAALCADLKKQPEAPRVVLFSGIPEEELAETARRAGADGHASKLGGVRAIVARVREVLASAAEVAS